MSYNFIRTVHLLLGLCFMLFLLTYGVSAVQMAHPAWFDVAFLNRLMFSRRNRRPICRR